jgi:tetratricopeptide (TPR) repeat protein
VLEEAAALSEVTEDPALHAQVRSALGYHLRNTSRYEPARAEFSAALDLARGAKDRRMETSALFGLGTVLSQLARYEEAISCVEQIFPISQEIGDREGAACATGLLGGVLHLQGRGEEAIAQFERQIEIARALGDRGLEAIPTGNLGNVFISQGRIQKARLQYERALKIAREIGDRHMEAANAECLATVMDSEGRSAEALARYEGAGAIYREVGDRQGEAINLHNEGIVLVHLGALQMGRAHQQAAVAIGREIGNSHVIAATLTGLADCLEESADLEAAEALHPEALAHFEETGIRDEHAASSHLHYGALLARSGRSHTARDHLEEALEIAAEAGTPGLRMSVLLRLALLDNRDSTEALAAFAESGEHMEHDAKTEARLLLYRLTGDWEHLEAAHDLLLFFVEHAPEQYRETTLTNVRLHREIMKAWEEHGKESEA